MTEHVHARTCAHAHTHTTWMPYELNPVKAPIYSFTILMDGYRDLPLQLPKTSLASKLPSLLKLPPANLEWLASFLDLSLDLCVQRLVYKSRNGAFSLSFLELYSWVLWGTTAYKGSYDVRLISMTQTVQADHQLHKKCTRETCDWHKGWVSRVKECLWKPHYFNIIIYYDFLLMLIA